MALRLYNTMSSRIEDFQTIRDHEVRMYACGPTVYGYGHIGNFRTFLAVDMLQRFLRQSGYSVRYVMNITDVDDKIIRNAAQAGVTVQQYTAKYEKAFLKDSALISIQQPTLVRATEHIPRMVELVQKLAYEHWKKRGSPLGSAEVDWFAAEKAVRAYLLAAGIALGPDEDLYS